MSDWAYPRETLLAHGGNSCNVYDRGGNYVACISRAQINAIDGGTIFVSNADFSVPLGECKIAPAKVDSFDPSKHQPDLTIPDDGATRGAFLLLCYAVALALLIAAGWLAHQMQKKFAARMATESRPHPST
jgi:hypothetical protein